PPAALVGGGLPAGEPVLVLEPLPDPAGRVPLLLRGLRVVVQDLTDDGEDRLDGRPPGRGHPAIPGRLLVGQDLLERQPVNVVQAAGFPLAGLARQHPTAGLGPLVHVGVHLNASPGCMMVSPSSTPRDGRVVRLTIPPPPTDRPRATLLLRRRQTLCENSIQAA